MSGPNLVGGLKGLRKRGIRFSRQHLRRLELAGKFPKRIRIGANSIDWIEEEIDDYVEARMRDRVEEAA